MNNGQRHLTSGMARLIFIWIRSVLFALISHGSSDHFTMTLYHFIYDHDSLSSSIIIYFFIIHHYKLSSIIIESSIVNRPSSPASLSTSLSFLYHHYYHHYPPCHLNALSNSPRQNYS